MKAVLRRCLKLAKQEIGRARIAQAIFEKMAERQLSVCEPGLAEGDELARVVLRGLKHRNLSSSLRMLASQGIGGSQIKNVGLTD